MKRSAIPIAVFALSICCSSLAHQDTPLPWHDATIRFGPPSEGNFLHIATNDDDELTVLTVHWNGKDFAVPSSEFKSLPDVQLSTLQVLDSKVPEYRYLNVSVRFGDDLLDEFPLASFLFMGAKYDHLMMIKRTSKTTWDYIQKYPGQEPQRATTASVIREAPSPKPQ